MDSLAFAAPWTSGILAVVAPSQALDHPAWYVLVFLASFAVDLIPVIAPPAWTAMVFLLVKFHLNPWIVLAAGVPGSTLGRYLLGLYVPKISKRFIKDYKYHELQFVGRKLKQNIWRSWLFVLTYSLLPLSTTALFSAAGIARVSPLYVIPPFFVGKFASDAFMVLTGGFAVRNMAGVISGIYSWKAIVTGTAGIVVICSFLFVDWRLWLERRKLSFNLRIWK